MIFFYHMLVLQFGQFYSVQSKRCLLDRSTAQSFYKRLESSLHKPTGNLLENLFSIKCVFKNNLQILEKKFLSQRNTTPKNGILRNKMAHLLKSSIFHKLIVKNRSFLNKVFIYYLNINFVFCASVNTANFQLCRCVEPQPSKQVAHAGFWNFSDQGL